MNYIIPAQIRSKKLLLFHDEHRKRTELPFQAWRKHTLKKGRLQNKYE